MVKEKDTTIFLDFGLSYHKSNEYFEFPLLQPSNINDLLKTGLIPELDGLYRYYRHRAEYDDTGPVGITPQSEERKYDGVLLSHAHMDHYGYIGLLRNDIPIYSSKISNNIIKLYSRSGRNEFNAKINHLEFKNLEYNKEEHLKDLVIKRYNVDHSILGASAFLVKGDKNLVYTGDLRLHGFKKDYTVDFLNLVQKEEVDYLLCEGTRMGLNINKEEEEVETKVLNSEKEVEDKCIEIVEAEENLIIYDASQADFERIRILWEVAKKTGRKLIIDSKKAFLLLHLNDKELLVPGLPTIEDFKILLGRSKLGTNTKRCKDITAYYPDFYLECFKSGRKYHENEITKDDSISEDNFIWGPELRKAVLENSNEYILYTSNGPLLLLHCKEWNKKFSGTYIYGKAEPFTEEMEFTFIRLLKWLNLCNLELEYAHTSGHSFPEDLKTIIETSNPKNLIPIHTTHPEEFNSITPRDVNIITPELNKIFRL